MPDIQERLSVKEAVIAMIRRLPDDCTMEDIQYHLYVRQTIEDAMQSLDDGKGISHEEVERRAQSWRKSSGESPA